MPKSPDSGSVVRVFVADVSRMSCQLMAAAFHRSRYRLKVVGYATDTAGVRAGLAKNEAEIVLVAAELKEGAMAGFQATREVRASHPKAVVIMILDSVERPLVIEAFRSGARGIYSREESFELLCKCAYQVSKGQVWASSKALRFVIDALSQNQAKPPLHPRTPALLTSREEGVVHLVAEGYTNRDISQQLNLSEHTVRNHLFRIFNKVGTSSRLELAIYARNHRREDDNDQV